MARRVRQQPRTRTAPESCTGLHVDHEDGSMSCTRGTACIGVAMPHPRGWTDCAAIGPCDHCARRPAWICDRS
ncbi:hypothetical protein ACIQH0_37675 [Streptomyces griseus]|uniref:hypothetical protein n=1 Tax=Streptomyces griseus TaxID=1911 RepID=UPI00381B47FA